MDHVLRRMGLHGHTFFELVLIQKGAGRRRVGRIEYDTRPGDLFIIPPGEIHDCAELGSAEGWVLLFTHQALESHAASIAFCWSWLPRHPLFVPFLTLSKEQPGPLRLDAARRETWSGHIAAIAAETETRAPGYQFGVHAHLSLLLLDLCRLTGSASQVEVVAHDPVMEAMFTFIEQNYKRQIRLADLARVTGRSAARLTTTVQAAHRADRAGVDHGTPHEARRGASPRCKPTAPLRRSRPRSATSIRPAWSEASRACIA